MTELKKAVAQPATPTTPEAAPTPTGLTDLGLNPKQAKKVNKEVVKTEQNIAKIQAELEVAKAKSAQLQEELENTSISPQAKANNYFGEISVAAAQKVEAFKSNWIKLYKEGKLKEVKWTKAYGTTFGATYTLGINLANYCFGYNFVEPQIFKYLVGEASKKHTNPAALNTIIANIREGLRGKTFIHPNHFDYVKATLDQDHTSIMIQHQADSSEREIPHFEKLDFTNEEQAKKTIAQISKEFKVKITK